MSSRVSFDSATWQGDMAPRMQRHSVPAHWATPGAVPSLFASCPGVLCFFFEVNFYFFLELSCLERLDILYNLVS
jgi:hypothetical protein